MEPPCQVKSESFFASVGVNRETGEQCGSGIGAPCAVLMLTREAVCPASYFFLLFGISPTFSYFSTKFLLFSLLFAKNSYFFLLF